MLEAGAVMICTFVFGCTGVGCSIFYCDFDIFLNLHK
ncbi:unnamed protein product [Acanthoscelides obtectus]|uniref:Uncharacterized protein n=1 Tax=Acanthoscelides obtectus TaxID=200917 RepID=A0A9P0LU15_ACAOB|nr:unnamed protein product [Acanthoscelides obtectus]CAK1675069.1 hypothetical protein AOBTE_LOCUS29881 [Acanthoscelides obtectus]